MQFVVPGSGVITGRANLNKFAEDTFKDKNFNITWTVDKIEVAASRDLAYETATETLTSTQGKKVVTSQGHGLVVWKKQADGSWKADADQSTELPPAAPQRPHRQNRSAQLGKEAFASTIISRSNRGLKCIAGWWTAMLRVVRFL